MFYTLIGFLKKKATPAYVLSMGLLSFIWLGTPASAALLLYEGFNYTPAANLTNQTHPNGSQWLRPSAPAGANQVIAAGDVNYAGLPVTPPSNSLSLPRPASGANSQNRLDIPGRPYTRLSGATIFFSFTMKMTAWTDLTAGAGADTKNDAGAKNATNRKGGNIAGLHGGAASTATAMSNSPGFAAPVLIRREIDYSQTGTDGTPGTQTGLYEIGILKQHGTPTLPGPPVTTDFAALDAAFDASVSFGIGETVFIVGQYDLVDSAAGGTNDIARLWINPTPGDFSLETTPSVTAPASVLNLGGTLGLESFHVKGDTVTPGDFLLDNIRIGTTYASVAVPEPSTIALLTLCALLVGGRRRKL